MGLEPNDDQKKQINNYVKYSAIGFQMLATIGIFVFIGYQIDKHRDKNSSLFTALFGVFGVAVSMYQIIRSLNKD